MITLFGAWTTLPIRLTNATLKVPLIIDRVVAREAHRFRNAVVKSFREGQAGGKKWRPLNPITLALRKGGGAGKGTQQRDPKGRFLPKAQRGGIKGRGGGSKPLVQTGTMRASTRVERRGYASYFVGQHRTGRGGADVARIHDSGPVVIPITDKMRKYFNYLFWKGVTPFPLSRRARYIVIPRRSSMTDTYKVFKRGSKARVLADFAFEMGRL